MVEQHIIPIDDIYPHRQTHRCFCKPTLSKRGDMLVYFHPSFDHREFWMSVETMLGMRCNAHHRYIDQEGEHCRVEPYFEYNHDRVDTNNQ